jgi:hypothetical protein
MPKKLSKSQTRQRLARMAKKAEEPLDPRCDPDPRKAAKAIEDAAKVARGEKIDEQPLAE